MEAAHTPGTGRAALLLLLAALVITVAHASPREPPASLEIPMTINNAMFDAVPLNVAGPNACSPPAPASPWQGVLIQAPTQVGFRPGKSVDGDFAAIPVCGFYRVELSKLLDSTGLMLVAVDLETNTRYAAAMLDEDAGVPEPDPGAPKLRAEDLKGMLSAAYFNPNLARYVKLPAKEAVYQVHVEYGGMVSNTVQIAVVRR